VGSRVALISILGFHRFQHRLGRSADLLYSAGIEFSSRSALDHLALADVQVVSAHVATFSPDSGIEITTQLL